MSPRAEPTEGVREIHHGVPRIKKDARKLGTGPAQHLRLCPGHEDV